jgi:hypothetical protein
LLGDAQVARAHPGSSRAVGLLSSPSIGQGLKGQAIAKNTIRLGYDKNAEAAAHFHAETFPDSAVRAVRRAPSDYPFIGRPLFAFLGSALLGRK